MDNISKTNIGLAWFIGAKKIKDIEVTTKLPYFNGLLITLEGGKKIILDKNVSENWFIEEVEEES